MKVYSNGQPIVDLKGMAVCFHQDFDLMDQTPMEAIGEFISELTQDQRNKLKSEIVELLKEFPGKQQKGLRKAWVRLRAEWWDSKNHDLKECLENCAKSL